MKMTVMPVKIVQQWMIASRTEEAQLWSRFREQRNTILLTNSRKENNTDITAAMAATK